MNSTAAFIDFFIAVLALILGLVIGYFWGRETERLNDGDGYEERPS